jgi:hypothetical protein
MVPFLRYYPYDEPRTYTNIARELAMVTGRPEIPAGNPRSRSRRWAHRTFCSRRALVVIQLEVRALIQPGQNVVLTAAVHPDLPRHSAAMGPRLGLAAARRRSPNAVPRAREPAAVQGAVHHEEPATP